MCVMAANGGICMHFTLPRLSPILQCIDYMFFCNTDSIDLDSSWKAARAFSILAFILACVILVVRLCVSCAPDHDAYASGIESRVAPLYLLTAVLQGLTLLFLNSKACMNNPLVE